MIFEMCKFRIWFRLDITSTILCHFTKFSKRLRNVVASTPIRDTNRKQFADFRGVRILVSTIFNRSHVQIKFGNTDFVFNGE